MGLQYTHEEVVKVCNESKRMLITEFETMVGELSRDISGECVWVDDLEEGIKEIKSDNDLET
jgi:hypothetical protein